MFADQAHLSEKRAYRTVADLGTCPECRLIVQVAAQRLAIHLHDPSQLTYPKIEITKDTIAPIHHFQRIPNKARKKDTAHSASSFSTAMVLGQSDGDGECTVLMWRWSGYGIWRASL
jgi:hypothetical protein